MAADSWPEQASQQIIKVFIMVKPSWAERHEIKGRPAQDSYYSVWGPNWYGLHKRCKDWQLQQPVRERQ